MQRHPGFAFALQNDKRAAESQEENQDGNHAQRDRRRIAALRRFAGPPAFIAISATAAARRRFFPSASSANVDDDQLRILGSHCPGNAPLSSLLALPACSLRICDEGAIRERAKLGSPK